MIESHDIQSILCQLEIAWKGLELAILSIRDTHSIVDGANVSYAKKALLGDNLADTEFKLGALRQSTSSIFNVMGALFRYIEQNGGEIDAYLISHNIKVSKNISDLASIIGYSLTYVSDDLLVC